MAKAKRHLSGFSSRSEIKSQRHPASPHGDEGTRPRRSLASVRRPSPGTWAGWPGEATAQRRGEGVGSGGVLAH